MRLHIVHGNKSLSDGTLHPEYRERIVRALSRARMDDVIVLTGGETRKGHPAEAVAAKAFLRENGYRSRSAVLLEAESLTTGDNIEMTRKMIETRDLEFDVAFVYHRTSALPKTRVLYERLWPGIGRMEFVPCRDTAPLYYRLLDRTLLVYLAHYDPHQVGPLFRFLKRMFRNA